MARPIKFEPIKTADGWMLSIPPQYSATGKRTRLFFQRKIDANAKRDELRERVKGYGQAAAAVRPSLAEDAAEAARLLDGHNVTLCDVARAWLATKAERERCPTVADAWEDALDIRKNHRPRTRTDLAAWQRALPAWFMESNTRDITADHIKMALSETTKGATHWKGGLRYISAVFGDLVKDKTLAENPAKGIQLPRAANAEEDATIYTPDELRRLLDACRDYPAGKDKKCASCAVPFAILAFAGIRPDELTKLRWENISLEMRNIAIGASVAKKARRRNVRINDTLAAWLETISEDKRTGAIIPARWRFKAARVRREAGFCGREKQDALRHSFGTYTLAVENDMDALKADMGHQHVAVFFAHYHKAITKRDALPYFEILPPGVKLPGLTIAHAV